MLEDKDLRSLQEVRRKVEAAYEAFRQYREFSQEQVDAVVDRAAAAARANAERLAQLAVEETGYGNVADKIAKNLLNSDLLHQYIRPLKTCGIIREDEQQGMIEIAEPMGVVAAILPTTNPTSTAFYKTLIALKARNAIVLSPHPRAIRCTCESARILAEAAEAAGAPAGVVQCLGEATIEGTNELMRHKRTAIILSTGGPGIVRAAYSSGKPALGVGPGNVPVLIDSTADVEAAVRSVVDGKSFDFGTVCSSEQAIVVERRHAEQVWRALKDNGAHVCTPEQTKALEKLLITPEFRINPDCVGQSPQRIAELAGFSVAESARILVVELAGVGREHPLSAEKLSPVLAVRFVENFEAALDACEGILNFGGRGHTCVIYSNSRERVKQFGRRMPAFRVLVNTPSPQGSTGITTNVVPSMTLGCGAIAGNSTSDNVGPLHLINIKRIAFKVRETEEAFVSEEARRYFTGAAKGPKIGAAPKKAAASAASPATSAAPSSSAIAAAVDRYLEQRGLARLTPGRAGSAREAAQTVVDRFLASRGAPPAASHGGCAACEAPVTTEPEAPSAIPAEPAPPAPKVTTVAFVCEDDIRRARTQGKKIYITAKTIVTPAARDLDSAGDVLVRTE